MKPGILSFDLNLPAAKSTMDPTTPRVLRRPWSTSLFSLFFRFSRGIMPKNQPRPIESGKLISSPPFNFLFPLPPRRFNDTSNSPPNSSTPLPPPLYRLTRELEKKLSDRYVVFVAQRRVLPKPKKGTKGPQKRPRSRTLTAVHEKILEDLVFPSEIVGKRTRVGVDGSKLIRA